MCCWLVSAYLQPERIIPFLGKCNQLLTLGTEREGKRRLRWTLRETRRIIPPWAYYRVYACVNYHIATLSQISFLSFAKWWFHDEFGADSCLYECIIYRCADHHLQAWANFRTSQKQASREESSLVWNSNIMYSETFTFINSPSGERSKVIIILSFVSWSVAIGSWFTAPTLRGCSKYSLLPSSLFHPFGVGSTGLKGQGPRPQLRDVLCFENGRYWATQCFYVFVHKNTYP